MRVFTVPAMYAPAILAAIKGAIADVDRHRSLERAKATDPRLVADYEGSLDRLVELLVPEASIDRSRTGDVVIVLGELPDETQVIALPLQRHLKASA
jgi:hypothetical protein